MTRPAHSSSDPSASDHGRFPLGEAGVLIAGQERTPGDGYGTYSPYDGAPAGRAHLGGPDEVEHALASIVRGFEVTRELPAWRRSEILASVSEELRDDGEPFAEAIAREAGKPLREARAETAHAAFTFQVAAEEARRIGGDILPLDWLPGMDGSRAESRSVPLGPISAITPFNYPLNLVAHKVAPALAAGDAIAVRPDPRTPTAAVLLGRTVLAAGWPADGIAIVPTDIPDAAPFVEDERPKLFTFTGSTSIGWMLKARAGRKRVTLELGGNAGTLVHHDADVARAAERIAWGGFTYAGQSCISVQRVFVHENVADEFEQRLLEHVGALRLGDPLNASTDIGPVIDVASAKRLQAWLDQAAAAGARVLIGGTVDGTQVAPTVLSDVGHDQRVACDEVFGPVVSLFRYRDVEEALARIDDSAFGLQAGLFTSDHELIERAFERLAVGGIVVGDVSTFRVDHMPYGGVKSSGLGREGVRSAIEDMTERKLLVHRKHPPRDA